MKNGEKKNREEAVIPFSPVSHSFNERVAFVTKSLPAAIIFNHLFFWIKINKSRGQNQIDGRTWMYESIPTIALHFSYLSEQQVKDALNILVQHGYLIKDQHAKNKFDRTNWYALGDESWIENTPIQKSFTKGSIDQMDECPGTSSNVSMDQVIYKDKDISNKDSKTDKSIAQPPAALRQKPIEISFSSSERKFTNITDQDLKDWKEIYPLVDINAQLKEMIQWLLSNPSKANSRQLWRKFITNWLKKEQVKLFNQEAYRQSKMNSAKKEILGRHTGFQKDNRPVHPSRTIDLSECTEETQCT